MFLLLPKDQTFIFYWPKWNYETSSAKKEVITTQTESEFKRTKVMYEAKLLAGEGLTDIDSPFSIDIHMYSSLTKLWRITVRVIRFIRKLRKESDLTGPLEATEIINAENTWTTYIQKTMYRDVIDSIQENKRHSLVSQLGLYLDKNGLIRCRGRLDPPGSNWCFSFAPELVGYSAPRDLHHRAACSVCGSLFLVRRGVCRGLFVCS